MVAIPNETPKAVEKAVRKKIGGLNSISLIKLLIKKIEKYMKNFKIAFLKNTPSLI